MLAAEGLGGGGLRVEVVQQGGHLVVEQGVQTGAELAEQGIPAGLGKGLVEGPVRVGAQRTVVRRQRVGQSLPVLPVGTPGSQPGRLHLDRRAQLHQVRQMLGSLAGGLPQPGEERGGGHSGHHGPLRAAARDEQPSGLQIAQSLTDGGTAHAQPLGQRPLRRDPVARSELAGADHLPEPARHLPGDGDRLYRSVESLLVHPCSPRPLGTMVRPYHLAGPDTRSAARLGERRSLPLRTDQEDCRVPVPDDPLGDGAQAARAVPGCDRDCP